MVSDFNERLVYEAMCDLGIGKKQILFTRASVSMYPRMKAANALRRGRQAYLDYSKSGLYPDFVIGFCEKTRQESIQRGIRDNVVNFAARKGCVPEINGRRPRNPKRP